MFTHSLGNDTYNGGADTDTVSFANGTQGVNIDLALLTATGDAAGDTFISIEKFIGTAFNDVFQGAAGAINETVTGGAEDDFLKGGGGADVLNGGADDDKLQGEAGSDTLNGGSGEDELLGGDDADILNGGGGSDLLTGGLGVDVMTGGPGSLLSGDSNTFIFTALADSGVGAGLRDIITDFTPDGFFVFTPDEIDVSAIDADINTPRVNDAYEFIGAAAFNNDGVGPGEIRAVQVGADTLLQFDVRGDFDNIVDFEILLTGVTATDIDVSEFVL